MVSVIPTAFGAFGIKRAVFWWFLSFPPMGSVLLLQNVNEKSLKRSDEQREGVEMEQGGTSSHLIRSTDP